jgi:hypothetical protein
MRKILTETSLDDNGNLLTERDFIDDNLICVRQFHPNGVKAKEAYFKNNLYDGIVRQWSPTGKLLGKFKMSRGTGMFLEWFDDGKLKLQMQVVAGIPNGPATMFDEKGAVLSSGHMLNGKFVSYKKYKQGRFEVSKAYNHSSDFSLNFVFSRTNRDALQWLEEKSNRTLGCFMDNAQSIQLVKTLYSLGAKELLAVEIDGVDDVEQNTDKLLITLPHTARQRRALFEWCSKQAEKYGFDPESDGGQDHVFVIL